jgi:nucleoside-diphosphate-sugar epimerase
MVHALIIGAAGMIGRKLAQRLARDGELAGREIRAVSLVDITPRSTRLSAQLEDELGSRVPVLKARTSEFPYLGCEVFLMRALTCLN